MARIIWNESGTRLYESGVDQGVLYLSAGNGVPWNGLVSVTDAPTIDGSDTQYIDGVQYRSSTSQEGFAATIEAFTYPNEFEPYIGVDGVTTGQARNSFGFTYRTLSGNDTEGLDRGYKIHLVYNALASPSEKTYETLDDSSDAATLSWNITTTPIAIEGANPSSHLIVDTTFAYSWAVEAFENLLYGSEINQPRLPTPQEVIDIFEDASILRITDNGDGTWTAEGPDSVIQFLDPTTFQITWNSVVYLDSDTYRISSL
jgi:hypothetical protein